MPSSLLDVRALPPFAKLEVQLGALIRRQVEPFARDAMLSRVESPDSLYNLALLKLDQVRKKFKYDSDLSEEHNEHRFLAMLKKYVGNEMIDRQYAANVDKRRPKGGGIISIDAGTSSLESYDDRDWETVPDRS